VCETGLIENKRVWKSVGIASAWTTHTFLALVRLWVSIPRAKITLTKEMAVSEPERVIMWVRTTMRKKEEEETKDRIRRSDAGEKMD
jgi:hypothetical protein